MPTVTLSALSSQPINTLSEEPLSITIPASVEGEPEVPVPSSISASSIVVFVEEFVTVDPFTVKFPVTVKLFPTFKSVTIEIVSANWSPVIWSSSICLVRILFDAIFVASIELSAIFAVDSVFAAITLVVILVSAIMSSPMFLFSLLVL